jgi:hypothetical protein
MDADDVCTVNRLAAQCEMLARSPHLQILGSRVRMGGETNAAGQDGMHEYVAWQNAVVDHPAIVADLFVESPLVHPSVMMPAGLLRELGGYRDFDGPEDYDLWLRAEHAGIRFGKHPEVLLLWRDGPQRLTRRCARYAASRFFELKAEALERRHLDGRPIVIWGAGPIGKTWARRLQARGHELRAFAEVDPRKLGSRIHGAPVLTTAQATTLRDVLHLSAVGRRDRREAIRALTCSAGLREGIDFIAVA